MGTEDNGDVGFQQNGVLNCPSSRMDSNSMSDKVAGMTMCSESMFKSPTGEEVFYGSGWDPLVSLNHGENYGCSSVFQQNGLANSHYSSLLENKPLASSSHHVHYPSDSVPVNMVPKLPSFGSGRFSDMQNSFGLPGCSQVIEGDFCPNYTSMKPVGSQEDCLITDEGAPGSSPHYKKRKASESHSPLNNKKNVEGDQQKDPPGNSSEISREKDEMKQKLERNNSTNLRGKQPCKQTNNKSVSEEPSKETYIHVRARRGQATNSHSVAERVRRERISERMRLLQELVPGCNKITGKAVMLDEIINYVQSLQQQVEFLSMKLATVNPELLDRMFSKDILQSSLDINASTLHSGQELNPSHMYPVFPQGTFADIPHASPAFPLLPQSVWDNELQSIFPLGFDSNTSINNPAQNGRSKLQL